MIANKIRALLLGVSLLLIPVFAVVATPVVIAQPQDAVCEGLGGCEENGQQGPSIMSVVATIINILSIIIGIIAVIMVIVGGLKYVSSAGDSNKLSSAKNTIIYALVGVLVAALAQVMVKFVLNRFIYGQRGSSNATTNLCRPDGSNPDPSRPCAR